MKSSIFKYHCVCCEKRSVNNESGLVWIKWWGKLVPMVKKIKGDPRGWGHSFSSPKNVRLPYYCYGYELKTSHHGIGLPFSCTDDQFYEFFQDCGEITEARVQRTVYLFIPS